MYSRNKYDQDLHKTDIRQSTAPLMYALNPIYAEICNPCLPVEVGYVSKQGVSYDSSKPMVDTESDLFNMNRLLSRDPSHLYQPHCTDKKCVGIIGGCDNCQPKLSHFPICDIRYESTRLSNPTSNFKGTGINRFQPLCLNPQDRSRWEHPMEVGINYRMIAKDIYVPRIPHPIDQSDSLPKGGSMPCEKTQPTCGAYTAPLHNYRIKSEKIPINKYR